jgi:hypothetical protein
MVFLAALGLANYQQRETQVSLRNLPFLRLPGGSS